MTLPDIPAILNDIWAQGSGGAVFMPTQKRPGRDWDPGPTYVPPIHGPIGQEWGYDRYFTPMTFFSGKLRGDQVAEGKVLYADLDKGDPWKLPPTYLWETSPGSLQAVWFTYEPMLPEQHANLNKRLTYWVGADRGGWGAAKVLRIPGTLNFKRQYEDDGGIMVPRGRLLRGSDVRYSVVDLDRTLPTLSEAEAEAGEVPHIPAAPPSASALPMGLRALLRARFDDRSKRCYMVAKEFAKQGLDAGVAWEYMWHAPFNKYTERPEVLWATIARAYAEVGDPK